MKQSNQNNPKQKATVKSILKAHPEIKQVKISYHGPKKPELVQILSTKIAIATLRDQYDKSTIDYKEFYYVMLLNRANFCIGICRIGEGNTHSCAVNLKEICQLALLTNASAVIVSHNHPSGRPDPSESDKLLNIKIKAALKLLDIALLDDIIITSSTQYSFADEGLL